MIFSFCKNLVQGFEGMNKKDTLFIYQYIISRKVFLLHPLRRHRHLRHFLLLNPLLRRHQICRRSRQRATIQRFIK